MAQGNNRKALPDAFDLSGQVALVTGSSKGIGEGVARVLAQAGAHVIVSSRKAEACEAVAQSFREEGLSAEALTCHIGNLEDIEAAGRAIRERHGGLDILVNNAVLSPWRSIEETDPSIFAKAVDVDLRGYWYMSVEVVKLMRPRGGGSIVNIASIAAWHPDRMLGLYSTLKTALIGMSRAFALEHGEDGVRANTILPGVIRTRLADAYDEEAKEQIRQKTTVKRLGEPEEIGHAVLYLTGPSGAYVSGATIPVDGGMSVALV